MIAIILTLTAGAIATVMPMFTQRQITEGARSLQAGLVGARDSAIRNNRPSGIRFLPSTTLTVPAMGSGSQPGTQQLAYDRWIEIEPAGDYTEGKLSIIPFTPDLSGGDYVAPYPFQDRGTVYPYGHIQAAPYTKAVGTVLRVEECIYQENPDGSIIPNNPTSWWWNIRVGDRLRLSNAGPAYVVVGPCTINPLNASTLGQNVEWYVNDGAPGTTSGLTRYYGSTPTEGHPEFLYLVNTVDDPSINLDPVPDPSNPPNFMTLRFARKDGYVNNGWDGRNNDYINTFDEAAYYEGDATTPAYYGEWEDETWQGAIATQFAAGSPLKDLSYVIERRAVPKRNAREVKLPGGIVIDATTWNSAHQERSRLNFDPVSLNFDFMVNADGQVVPQSIYGLQSSFVEPFLHFWITDNQDVVPRASQTDVPYELPMLKDTLFYPDADDKLNRVLKGDRRLVTVFAKSGLVLSGNIESAVLLDDSTTPPTYSSGFIGYDQVLIGATVKTISGASRPFLDAQNGFQSAK